MKGLNYFIRAVLAGALCSLSLLSMVVTGATHTRPTAAPSADVSVCVSRFVSPHIFAIIDGSPVGYLNDSMRYVARNANWQLNFLQDTPANCKVRAISGEVDLVYPLVESDPLAAGALLSEQHLDITWARLYAPRGTLITSFEDLSGLRVGLVSTDTLLHDISEALTLLGAAASYRQYMSFADGLAALKAGDIDAITGEHVTLFAAVQDGGVYATPLRYAVRRLYVGAYHAAAAHIVQVLDAELVTMLQDPEARLYARYSHWIGKDADTGLNSAEQLVLSVLFMLVFAAAGAAWVFRSQLGLRHRQLQRTNDALSIEIGERKRIENVLQRVVDRFERLSGVTQDVIFDWDLDADSFWQNDAATELLGGEAEVHSRFSEDYDAFNRLIHPEDRARVRSATMASIARRENPQAIEFRISDRQGCYRHVLQRLYYEYSRRGAVKRAIVCLTDITALHDMRIELDNNKRRLSSLVSTVPGAVIRVNIVDSRTIEFVSPAIEEILGVKPSELVGAPMEKLLGFIHADDLDQRMGEEVYGDPSQTGPFLQELRMIDVYGVTHWVNIRCTFVRQNDGIPNYADITIFDMTDFVQLTKQVSYQSTHEELTGLLHRGEFERRIKQLLEDQQWQYSEHSLYHIDIDQYTMVRERWGLRAADTLVKQLAQTMQPLLHDQDLFARYTGGELGLLLAHRHSADAAQIIREISEQVEALRFCWNDEMIAVTLSVGQTFISANKEPSDIAALMRQADAALYLAKVRGGQRIELYSVESCEGIDGSDAHYYQLLRACCKNDDFALYYETIIALRDGAPRNSVALQVCAMQDGQAVCRDDYIFAAEFHRFASYIDLWSLHEIATWMDSNKERNDFDVFHIPLSAQTMASFETQKKVLDILTALGDDCCKICLEFTESAVLKNYVLATDFFASLAALGCSRSVSCDNDGFSSYGQLRLLPITYFKSDGQLSGAGDTGDKELKVVRALSEIAHVLERQSIIAGVTSESVLNELREIQVDYVQGPRFGALSRLPSSGTSPHATVA